MQFTEETAYQLSYLLWVWLFLNPGKKKEDSPYWNQIKRIYNHCPLCAFYKTKHTQPCNLCIGIKLNKYWSHCFNDAYHMWGTTKEKRYSGYIASKIRREMKRKGYEIKSQL